MCMVSAVGDNWSNTFLKKEYWDRVHPLIYPQPNIHPAPASTVIQVGVGKEDFEALKKEVLELKELLKAAKKFDEATGQKDCEMEDKIDLMRRVAKLVGVDLGL
jgi:hypothetical protein